MTPKIDTHELAWAAGFFDGEGYVGAQKTRLGRQAVLDIGQADTEVLARFQKAVGLGRLRGPYAPSGKQQRPRYRLQISSFEQVQAVIAMLWPWLGTVKREQAKRALTIMRVRIPRNRVQHLRHAGGQTE